MATKLFLDTDVIIDFLIDRRPHSIYSANIFDLAEEGKLILYISSLSISNIHYIIRKVLGQQKSREVIHEIMSMVEVLEVSKYHIQKALKSSIKDFEDAIQHEVAYEESAIKAILTRNIRDYKNASLSIFSPEMWCNDLSD
ncbi:PIN domain-containing protein [Echinicola strongylocentroti]|uniref:PIN domain-containing protein n=1 Tax=Echinicola strongylocentroti TaxID=1795355 RepID=A0A2Z4IJA7_9BACT|nr:PIN domain-containing protein [Echinicola strongylocentroti]AWW31211.1 PIN domain-containing protein [Echinicola strongylocentroti]